MKPKGSCGLLISLAAWLLLAALCWFVYERGFPRVENYSSQIADSNRAPVSDFETTSGQTVYTASLLDKETLAPGVTAPGRDVLVRLTLSGNPTQLCSAVIELRDLHGKSVAESGTTKRCVRTKEQLRVTQSTATKDGESAIALRIPGNTAEGTVLATQISLLFYESVQTGTIQQGGVTRSVVYGARDPLVEQTLYSPAGIAIAQQNVVAATPESQWRQRMQVIALQHIAVILLALLLFGLVPSLLEAEREDARVLVPVGLMSLVNSFFLSFYLFKIVLNTAGGEALVVLVVTGVIAYLNIAITMQIQTHSLNFIQSLKSRSM